MRRRSKLQELSFDVRCTVAELLNVPFDGGQVYVKLSGPGGLREETPRCSVENHTVLWHRELRWSMHLPVSKEGLLEDYAVEFSVRQADQQQAQLGVVRVNVASILGSRRCSHKFLLEKAALNATLKLDFAVQQLSGAPTFRCPALRSGDAPAPSSTGGAGRQAADAVQTMDQLLTMAKGADKALRVEEDAGQAHARAHPHANPRLASNEAVVERILVQLELELAE